MLHPWVQEIGKERHETSIAEPGPANQAGKQEENTQAVEAETGKC